MLLLLTLLACDTGPDYGIFNTIIRGHRKTLELRPCEVKVVRELASALSDAGDKPAALETYRTYEAACDADATVVTAHLALARKQELGEEALGLARMLLELAPDNKVYLRQLTDLLLEHGRPAEAVPVLRRQYLSSPKDHDALQRLAEAEEAAGSTCDAMVSWGILWWVSSDRRGKAAQGVARAEETGTCPGVALAGPGTVKQHAKNGYWRFQTWLAGHESWLGLDTGAPITYVTPEAFAGVEGATVIDTDVTMKAGTGRLVGDLYRVPEIKVGTVVLEHTRVLVAPRIVGDIDGFLGLDVGSRMRMREKSKSHWTLTPP